MNDGNLVPERDRSVTQRCSVLAILIWPQNINDFRIRIVWWGLGSLGVCSFCAVRLATVCVVTCCQASGSSPSTPSRIFWRPEKCSLQNVMMSQLRWLFGYKMPWFLRFWVKFWLLVANDLWVYRHLWLQDLICATRRDETRLSLLEWTHLSWANPDHRKHIFFVESWSEGTPTLSWWTSLRQLSQKLIFSDSPQVWIPCWNRGLSLLRCRLGGRLLRLTFCPTVSNQSDSEMKERSLGKRNQIPLWRAADTGTPPPRWRREPLSRHLPFQRRVTWKSFWPPRLKTLMFLFSRQAVITDIVFLKRGSSLGREPAALSELVELTNLHLHN